jgi:hypothetical protein
MSEYYLKKNDLYLKHRISLVSNKEKEITMEIFKSILFFVLAGLSEIGGGYLVWLWLREGKDFEICNIRSNTISTLRDYSHFTTC